MKVRITLTEETCTDHYCDCKKHWIEVMMQEPLEDGTVKILLTDRVNHGGCVIPTHLRLRWTLWRMTKTLQIMFKHRGEVEFIK